MEIAIRSTDQLTELDGVDVRVWEGVTERGVACKVFVHRIAVSLEDDIGQFEKELREELPPGRKIPLSAVP